MNNSRFYTDYGNIYSRMNFKETSSGGAKYKPPRSQVIKNKRKKKGKVKSK